MSRHVLQASIMVCAVLEVTGCRARHSEQTSTIVKTATLESSSPRPSTEHACAPGATCDGRTGLCAPLAACTANAPCRGIAGKTIKDPIDLPTCRTTKKDRPAFDDGPPRQWVDSVTGEPRAACVFEPPGTSSAARVPLVVFFHGSHGSAGDAYDAALLRAKAASFHLGGAGAPQGFVLASVQGRNLEWPNKNPPGSHHDFYFRDLASPSANPDIRNADRLVDELAAKGNVDPARIYVMGWSNGAFFASLYSIARHDTPTPAGHRVAAAVAFAGGDPFSNTTPNASPSCAMTTVPTTHAPIQLIHRACDTIVPCNTAQGSDAPPGFDVESWARTLRERAHDPNVVDILLDRAGHTVQTCEASCGMLEGTTDHLRWPDGVADRGGIDSEPVMLAFLRDHPHR
jgi:poly(3-hydroxybutyrate) depolymerase